MSSDNQLDFLTKITAVQWDSGNLIARINYRASGGGNSIQHALITGLKKGSNLDVFNQAMVVQDDTGASVVDPPTVAMEKHLYAWTVPGSVNLASFTENQSPACEGGTSVYVNASKEKDSSVADPNKVTFILGVPGMSTIPAYTATAEIVYQKFNPGWLGPFDFNQQFAVPPVPYGPPPPPPYLSNPGWWIAVFWDDPALQGSVSVATIFDQFTRWAGGFTEPLIPSQTPVVGEGPSSGADALAGLLNAWGGAVFALTGAYSIQFNEIKPAWSIQVNLYTWDKDSGDLTEVWEATCNGEKAFQVHISVDIKAQKVTTDGPNATDHAAGGGGGGGGGEG